MLGKLYSAKNRSRRKTSGKQQRLGVTMADREATLGTLGIALGGYQATSGSFEYASETSFSAYSDYTPVTVRSHTTKTDHAGVERDKPRNR
jgi:hypothetical protein